MAVVTGPNMGGKSTFLRTAALLVVLAQLGSFVPAELMRFGLADRIFTRIGASDFLAKGQSTFMVEMTETARILNQVTPRSLVILDEIGRGTSTRDGLALAEAIALHLRDLRGGAPRTLFATHFFELTRLAEDPRIRTSTWKSRSGRSTCSSCTASPRARRTAATASRWPAWRAFPGP